MDFSLIISKVLGELWWLILIVLAIRFIRLPRFKGWIGEYLVRLATRILLPSKTYHPIHNVTLPTPDGTTQIDHIFVSRYGIFVVETKNMKGWIFGGEHQSQWTQQFYKKSIKFQNPLRQNFKHVKALEAALDLPAEAIHSVVVFAGGSTFKSAMPANVTRVGGYITYIKSFRDPVLSEAQVHEVVARIASSRLTPSRETDRQHVELLKTRSNPNAERKCQKCGSDMVLRTAKRGANAGNKFWGCSTYPKCRMVQNLT